MMTALQQTPTQTGLASILAALGGTAPGATGDSGFEQLLAAAPANGIAPVNAAATVQILPASIDGAVMDVAPVAADAGIAADTAAPTPVPAPVRPAPVEGKAATEAANLLMALTTIAEGAPAAGKPAAAAPAPFKAETAVETVVADAVQATAVPVAAVLQAITAAPVPASAKPAKKAEVPASSNGAAPAAPVAAKLRPLLPALTGADLPAAKPADTAAPSMSILFAQTETQGAAPPIDVAQPAVIAERLLDMTSDDLWIEQLARDIAATKSDSGDISFRLMPRHLGRLDVAMQMGDEGVSVKLDTQHEATAVIVTAAQGKLVEDLRQQGVRVAGTEVTCTPGETGRQSQQGQSRGAAADASHLIETASDGAETRADRPHDERTADRRGRFA